MLVPAAVFLGVLTVVYTAISLADRRRVVALRRLDEHAVHVNVNEARKLERVAILREQNYSSIAAVNALLRNFKPAKTAVTELERANVELTVPQYLFGRVVLAAFVAVGVQSLTGVAFIAVPAALLSLMLPRIVLNVMASKRRNAFEAQLAEAIDLLVGAMRAGYGFLQAIDSASKETEDPMRCELLRVLDQVNAGSSPVDALQNLPRRIVSYDLALLVTAVTVQRSIGGNLAEVLDNIASTVRERRRIREEVKAITTGPRVSSYILGLFPIGLMLFFVGTDQNYRHIMLHESVGKIMLGFAAAWSLIGFAASTGVSKVEY